MLLHLNIKQILLVTENNGTKNGVKKAVPLEYLSNFWRSLEIPIISCKVELSLKWIENCILTTAANANKAIFKITDAKLYVPIVTLSIEDNSKLSKLLNGRFKRPIYWNEYKVTPNKKVEIADLIKHSINDSINDSIKQYDEVRKISTGQSDDSTTGCLLDFAYFEKSYRLIAADLSKQKALDADSRAIQQIIFTGKIKATVANTRAVIFYILQKSKETILEFSKGTTKVL